MCPNPKDSLLLSNRAIGIIPLKNELVFYSKFDQQTGSVYLSQSNVSNFKLNSELVHAIDGPFSSTNSSFHSTCYCALTVFRMDPKADLFSFTLSFFLRINDISTFGIYQDEHEPISPLRFSLLAVGTNIELHTHNSSSQWPDPARWDTVSSFTFANVLKVKDWTFVGLVYEATSKTLKFYDQFANVIDLKTNVQIDPVATQNIRIGDSRRFGTKYQFSPYSAIACLSLHKTALSQMDMALLPCACQFKDERQTI